LSHQTHTKMKKAIFINAETREIVSVNLKDSLKETYQMLNCNLVEGALYLDKNDLLVVDEEGYFTAGRSGFYFQDMFFYGNGMIWGADEDGDTDDFKSDIDYITSQITWVDADMSAIIRERQLNRPAMVMAW